jgi:hypothetical protein
VSEYLPRAYLYNDSDDFLQCRGCEVSDLSRKYEARKVRLKSFSNRGRPIRGLCTWKTDFIIIEFPANKLPAELPLGVILSVP